MPGAAAWGGEPQPEQVLLSLPPPPPSPPSLLSRLPLLPRLLPSPYPYWGDEEDVQSPPRDPFLGSVEREGFPE